MRKLPEGKGGVDAARLLYEVPIEGQTAQL
eukprot:COSAG06_NODE_55977_length_287_cov_0.553191_1_plen_29_part_10